MLPLDVGVEESVRLPVHKGGDQGGLQNVPALHETVERVVQDARGPADVATGAEGDVSLELAQRGVGEHEGGGGDPRVYHGVPEETPLLTPLDRERGRERHRSPPDEDRRNRSPPDGAREVQLPVLELELDG